METKNKKKISNSSAAVTYLDTIHCKEQCTMQLVMNLL